MVRDITWCHMMSHDNITTVARDDPDCPIVPDMLCGMCITWSMTLYLTVILLTGSYINDSYCIDSQAFVGIPIPINGHCTSPDDQCLWKPCEFFNSNWVIWHHITWSIGCFEATCPLSGNYAAEGIVKAKDVTLSWSAYQPYVPKLLISWSQSLPGKYINVGNGLKLPHISESVY